MVVSALLVTLGLAQTPGAGSNTDPANVKGCLSGSDGNYTVVEDGSRQTFKITTSSVDLKPHLGHDVKLIGHKAGATASPGAADNSFAVTELNMISEHCAAAAAAPAATVIPPAETVIAPDPAPAAAATTASAPLRIQLHPQQLPVRPQWKPHRLLWLSARPPDAVAPAVTVTVAPTAATRCARCQAAAPAVTVAPPAAAPATPAVEAAAARGAGCERCSPATVSPCSQTAAAKRSRY
jgi:hypothetical protein